MKLLLISDTHNQHNKIPQDQIDNKDGSIDMIIHAGDVSGRGSMKEIEDFLSWYDSLNFKYKIFIPGNHDFWFEKLSTFAVNEMLQEKYPTVIYLHDTNVEIEGLKIHGSGVTPWFYDWAFNKVGAEIIPHWDMIPLDTDVLITHGPAKGYLDYTLRGVSTGCPYLLEKISKLTNLKLFVCGHIHEAYGQVDFPDGGIFVNASTLNFNYNVQNKPIIVEINK